MMQFGWLLESLYSRRKVEPQKERLVFRGPTGSADDPNVQQDSITSSQCAPLCADRGFLPLGSPSWPDSAALNGKSCAENRFSF